MSNPRYCIVSFMNSHFPSFSLVWFYWQDAQNSPRSIRWPASPSPEPTLTDWGSGSPHPGRYAPPPVRKGHLTVAGWSAGELGGAGTLREVGGEDEGGAGEATDLPLRLTGREGREAEGKGA